MNCKLIVLCKNFYLICALTITLSANAETSSFESKVCRLMTDVIITSYISGVSDLRYYRESSQIVLRDAIQTARLRGFSDLEMLEAIANIAEASYRAGIANDSRARKEYIASFCLL